MDIKHTSWNRIRYSEALHTYLIAFDRLARIKQEKMVDSQQTTRFQFDHTYDSAGNRTALAIAGNVQPRELDIKQLQDALRKDEVDLDRGGDAQEYFH